MNKYLRKETLENLIEKIYGITTVNIDQKSYERGTFGEVIFNKNGLYDHNTYTLKIRNNFDALFDSTFNTPKKVFSANNLAGHTEYNRDTAIQNAVAYFQEFGINVPNFFENKQDKNLLSKLIYKLISTELLLVIFDTDDNRKKRESDDLNMDDITPNFTIAINNVKAILEAKDIVSRMYRNAKMSDIETVYENNYKGSRNEYSLVTCMCIEDIYDFKHKPWSFDSSIEIDIATKPYEIYYSDGSDFSTSIEQLKKQSLLLTYDAEAAFEIPEDLYAKRRKVESITINFLKNTASLNFLPRYFYYAPKLDQNSKEFCRKNSSILWSEVSLFQKIRSNAEEALRIKYMDDFKKSYENVLDSIITNSDMLTNVDFEYLLNSNSCEEQKLVQALGNMWPNINRLYTILYDGGYETSEIKSVIIWLIEYSVSMLNSAIEGILSVTHIKIGAGKASSTDVSEFVTQLRDYVSRYDIRKFVTKIEAYFDKLQKTEELFEVKNSDVYNKIKELGAYISIDIKSDFSKTKKNLSEIELDEAVFKSFRQNLTKLTSVLKEN